MEKIVKDLKESIASLTNVLQEKVVLLYKIRDYMSNSNI